MSWIIIATLIAAVIGLTRALLIANEERDRARSIIVHMAARIDELERGRALKLNGKLYQPHQTAHLGSRVWRITIPNQ
jgi:hypothetical protein